MNGDLLYLEVIHKVSETRINAIQVACNNFSGY